MPPGFQELIDRLQTKGGIGLLTVIAAVTFFVGVIGGATTARHDSAYETVSTTSTTAGSSVRRNLSGFEGVAFTVSSPNDGTKKYCGAYAQTAEQQTAGMMNQTSFGGYDAMLFPFESDTSAQFYMRNVQLPLVVSFFDGGGKFISSSEMPPCVVEQCVRYGAARPFRFALETPQGGLVVPAGSTVVYGGPCS